MPCAATKAIATLPRRRRPIPLPLIMGWRTISNRWRMVDRPYHHQMVVSQVQDPHMMSWVNRLSKSWFLVMVLPPL